MNGKDDMRGKLMYHAQMFVLAVFCGVGIVVALAFVVYVLLSLGFVHRVPDH